MNNLLKRKKELEELRDIFIEAKDWTEVSNIQYEIDQINVPQKIETWFKVFLFWNQLPKIRAGLNKFILIEKYREKHNDKHI